MIRRKSIRGFTLIEILVVVAIISVLFSLLSPAISAAKESARRVQCASNMRQIGVAFRCFQDDHDGRYPHGWDDNSNNWQSYLAFEPSAATPNSYLPTVYITWNPSNSAKRFQSFFWCPTEKIILSRGNSGDFPLWWGAPNLSDNWGYSLDAFRTDVSYSTAYWVDTTKYANVNLDVLYSNAGSRAVLTDGNGSSWNGDNDYNAFTGATSSYEYKIVPVHGDGVNTLFMDGHVEYMKVRTAAQQAIFNQAWYGGVPASGNPWPD